MADKIPLWKVLQKLDERDYTYYDNLSIEDKKQISMYPLLINMSCVEADSLLQEYYSIMTNNMANKGFWELSKYPELQWRLLAAAGVGFKQKHKWVGAGKRLSKTPKIDELLLKINPKMNDEELNIVKSKLKKEELVEYTRNYGISDKDAKQYTEEFKKLTK